MSPAYEKDHRDRDLGRDERRARTEPSSLSRGMAAVSKRRGEAQLVSESGKQTHDDSRREGHGEGEGEYRAIDRDPDRAGREPGDEGGEDVEPLKGEDHSEGAAGERKKRTLDEGLLQDAAAAGAEGGSERHFSIPAHEPGHREVRHVGAGDEEDQSRSAEQNEESRPSACREGLLKRGRADGVAAFLGIRLRIVALESLPHRLEVGTDRLEVDAVADPAEDGHGSKRAAVLVHLELAPRAERTGRSRHVDVVLLGKLGNRRKDPDDGVDLVVHLERPADDPGVTAEGALPVPVAQDEDRIRSEVVVLGPEGAPVKGHDSENVEKLRRNDAGRYPFRLVLSEKGERHRVVLDQTRERLVRVPVVVDLLDGEREVRDFRLGRALLHHHETFPLAIRKRRQEDPMDEAEDRGIGADPETEGQDRGDRETGAFEKAAESVADVTEQRLHGFSLLDNLQQDDGAGAGDCQGVVCKVSSGVETTLTVNALFALLALDLAPCHLERLSEEVLCGVHEVFEDREAKAGPRIGIHVAVLPALLREAEGNDSRRVGHSRPIPGEAHVGGEGRRSADRLRFAPYLAGALVHLNPPEIPIASSIIANYRTCAPPVRVEASAL